MRFWKQMFCVVTLTLLLGATACSHTADHVSVSPSPLGEIAPCEQPATVTCDNQCRGGMCCQDESTPKGWAACDLVCVSGSPWCQ